MQKIGRLGGLIVIGMALMMAAMLVSCESSSDWATLTIDNRTREWLKIFIDTEFQQNSPPYSISMVGISSSNTHWVAWEGPTVHGEVFVTLPTGGNLVLKINENDHLLE